MYRLHFDYGYSARRISEMMKINRNTVNGDIDYWYVRILKKEAKIINPEIAIVINIQRLEIQRSRLREQLDKAKSVQEKMPVERLIYEIDCKILYTYSRLSDSEKRSFEHKMESLNTYLKENNSKTRYMTLSDKISVSHKTLEKINKLIQQDRTTPPHHI